MRQDIARYRFASGPLKGQPLQAAGMSWQLSNFGGKPVAVFSDGRITDFYVEDVVVPRKIEVTSGRTVNVRSAAPAQQIDKIFARRVGHLSKLANAPACAPVYSVRAGGIYTDHSRGEVGTGLREYLWLYAKLRAMNRRIWCAAWEAWQLYSL